MTDTDTVGNPNVWISNGRLLLIFIGYLQAGLSPKRPYLFDIDMVSLVYDVAICSFVTLSFVF
ncbi:hypothetical protein AXFE_16460 [Acidithrix ferrooxidans]|uniref:Uncharacterized protein n=1 Tax=Acidithrix ferrooxidans TaxID=1280514 RepID=A0A0D8HHT9_9ACTN|nr:hypothetical protein AXFE_16460 [Acidithrix ferrooxidans]